MFKPIPLAICKRCRQYSIGTRAAWISPQRICSRWPSSRKSFVPMAKVCMAVEGFSAACDTTMKAHASAARIVLVVVLVLAIEFFEDKDENEEEHEGTSFVFIFYPCRHGRRGWPRRTRFFSASIVRRARSKTDRWTANRDATFRTGTGKGCRWKCNFRGWTAGGQPRQFAASLARRMFPALQSCGG